jgi:hypothetical protein
MALTARGIRAIDRRAGAFVFACFLTTGCTSGPSESVKTARDEAGTRYFQCMKLAADRLDNGREDILTVALAVKVQCGKEWLEYTKLSSAHLSAGYQPLYLTERDAKRLEEAAEMVAFQRTRRSQSNR